ncbi:hydrogenase maturation protease [Phytoactinopolyspora mesophila]|uniref:Hydrogenase maturation protease n=1 Tax=Phytoactinopolyspora mesophila TaxID=2650750 RepID=A0A7K3M8Q6_9ACTN|nr:hydrogenase maturation protease [Phytoactinopolyspora mesophila]NDL59664.1 hydrogenase maturation protease [Phytoactinopolyspora mesophila]
MHTTDPRTQSTSTGQIVVIGVGNDLRRDDGLGPTVIRRLGRCTLPHVTLAVCDGEPSRLLELWSGADLAIVVDAVQNDPARPGHLHEIIVDRPVAANQARTSSHGLGVGEAVELALTLDRMPRRLVILAVEGADFSVGQGLTPAVVATLDRLTHLINQEISYCQR